MFTDGFDRSDFRYRYFGLDRDVIKVLIEEYNFSQPEAEKAIEDYKPVFSMVDKYTDAWHIAYRIKTDRERGLPPNHYIETLGFFKESSELLAEVMKMPDTANRKHEYCYKCNYPKYIDEDCSFCK
jgi:hypothetical protein